MQEMQKHCADLEKQRDVAAHQLQKVVEIVDAQFRPLRLLYESARFFYKCTRRSLKHPLLQESSRLSETAGDAPSNTMSASDARDDEEVLYARACI